MLDGQGPDGRGDRAPLAVDVDPEPADAGHAVAEIQLVAVLPVLLEMPLLFLRQDVVNQAFHRFRIQPFGSRDGGQIPRAPGRPEGGRPSDEGPSL